MPIHLSCVRSLGGALTVAFSFGLATSALAWNGPLWVRQLGTVNTERSVGVATDPAGNVYITGYAINESDGDGVDFGWAWVVKYDAAGQALWKRRLGTAEPDEARGLATDAAGNVYLAGSTWGSFGGPNRGGYDAWTLKYDAGGNVLWKRQLGSDSYDFAFGVATDAAGDVYLAGETGGSLGGVNRGDFDAWLAKYDGAGHLLWKRQLGTAEWERAEGVATDAAGNVYVTGWTGGSLGGANRGGRDAWVVKYDTDGRLLWKRQFGTERDDYAQDAATDPAGRIYLAGYTQDEDLLSGTTRAWLTKYDASGHVLWKRRFAPGPGGRSYAFGVTTDKAGLVYLAGSAGGDAWVAKYDAAGELLWKRRLGTTEPDGADDVAADAAGNIYLTGDTYGSLGGHNRSGSSDAWVAKYSAER